MKNNHKKIYEADLYQPIRNFFVAEGYEVYGEVRDCDITAVKEEELIIIELKKNLTVDLLVQAAHRQRLTDEVYIAIPKPKQNLFSKKWKDICHLIKRLELGLILVSFQKDEPLMEIKIKPASFDRKKAMQRYKKQRMKVLEETKGRHGDYNIGGSHRTKIMTAYKENCIHIACLLDRFGPSTPKMLREKGAADKTPSILQRNYNGWYEKISRGTYTLSEKGKAALAEFPDIVQYYQRLMNESMQ